MLGMCEIVVVKRDVLKENDVDNLVVLEDLFMFVKGKLVLQVLNIVDGGYKKKRESFKKKICCLFGLVVVLLYLGILKYKIIV